MRAMKKDKNSKARITHSLLGMNRIDEAHELENMDRFGKYTNASSREAYLKKSKRSDHKVS
ncbi:MAG: hypothetical protein ABI477_19355 [Chryseolinea sp.]